MNISQAILQIYPTLDYGKDYEVFDNSDGKGVQLTWLNKTITQPTKAQLQTAWLEVKKDNQKIEASLQARKEIFTLVAGENATRDDVIWAEMNAVASVLTGIAEENPALLTNTKVKAGATMFAGIKAIRDK